MGFFGKFFSGFVRQGPSKKPQTGDMRKTTGAGPLEGRQYKCCHGSEPGGGCEEVAHLTTDGF